MPKYKAQEILARNNKAIPVGAVITLTEEEAERLGKKVIPLEVADPDKPIKALTLKELKGLAKIAGVVGYSRKDKPTLVTELTLIQQGEAVEPASEPVEEAAPDVVVGDDESDGN